MAALGTLTERSDDRAYRYEQAHTCCFLVMSRSISSTSSTVTRLLAPLLLPPIPLNMASKCSAAAAGEACLPVSACRVRHRTH